MWLLRNIFIFLIICVNILAFGFVIFTFLNNSVVRIETENLLIITDAFMISGMGFCVTLSWFLIYMWGRIIVSFYDIIHKFHILVLKLPSFRQICDKFKRKRQ